MFIRQIRRIALSLVLAVIPCSAQQSAPTVDVVLARIRENVAEFQKSIPGFTSDELVISQRFDGPKLKDQMKTNSSFEMEPIGTDGRLRETRHIKLVDGKVPKDPQKVSLPYTFSGGYADVIHYSQSRFDDFHIQSAPGAGAPLVLVSSPRPISSGQPNGCTALIHSIKATIDPVTFQVLRLETVTQDIAVDLGFRGHFIDVPSSRNNIVTISIDYAPIDLGGKTFWLTQTVTNDFKDKSKPVHMHYEAHYTNYHRYASTSTILPGEPVAPETIKQP